MTWTYTRFNRGMIKVSRRKKFAGWLLSSPRWYAGPGHRKTTWVGDIGGRKIKAASVTAAKAKIERIP